VATAEAPVVYGRFRKLREVVSHRMGAARLQLVRVREGDESGPPGPPAWAAGSIREARMRVWTAGGSKRR
jgi:hypothetical protein